MKKRIFVSIRTSLLTLLESEGYEIEGAVDGKDGWLSGAKLVVEK
jgi:hypothetical protein